FENGHGSAELYQPAHLVKNNDVIVITCNYRLGALGYLDWSYFNSEFNSNNGISDQINVIKWVHLFIESFGGNPNNVTLMGQSA
ncbi:carboxylesterase family protein, partial [Staphylococcus aureus]|nr:carboxylesterase family protein [Staphylococcus aureus]